MSSLTQRASIVAAGTLFSRFLGLARDAVIAATFVTTFTDAFWLAFTIPNALRVLFGEGAASAAFVPVLAEARQAGGDERARQFYGRLTGRILLIVGVVTVLGVVFAEELLWLYADEDYLVDTARAELTENLIRMVFPYIFFMSAAALLSAALFSRKRFAVPAFTPALLNISFILAALVGMPWVKANGYPAVYALAGGALIGGALQAVMQLPALHRIGDIPRISFRGGPYVRKSIRLLLPLLIALGVYQLNIVMSRRFATSIPGGVSYLFYGQRLVEIPQGVFGIAIAAAALPSLSDVVAKQDFEAATALFVRALSLTLFVGIPSSVGLALIAEPAVGTLLGRGVFDAHQVTQTARSLVWLAAGVWAVASVRTVVPMFHAYQDTKTPVLASIVNVVVFVTVSFLLIDTWQHVGLAVAITAASVCQLFSLLIFLRWRRGPLGLTKLITHLGRVCTASAIMGGVVYATSRGIASWLGAWSALGEIASISALTLCVGMGALSYAVSCKVLQIREYEEVASGIRRRLRRSSQQN